MSEKIYQEVLRHLREGRPESLLFACGCVGCPDEFWTDGSCECGKRCRCSCTLPGRQEAMAARNAEIRGYIDRAKAELGDSYKPPMTGVWHTIESFGPLKPVDYSPPPEPSPEFPGIYMRSDGTRLECPAEDFAGLFWATDGQVMFRANPRAEWERIDCELAAGDLVEIQQDGQSCTLRINGMQAWPEPETL